MKHKTIFYGCGSTAIIIKNFFGLNLSLCLLSILRDHVQSSMSDRGNCQPRGARGGGLDPSLNLKFQWLPFLDIEHCTRALKDVWYSKAQKMLKFNALIPQHAAERNLPTMFQTATVGPTRSGPRILYNPSLRTLHIYGAKTLKIRPLCHVFLHDFITRPSIKNLYDTFCNNSSTPMITKWIGTNEAKRDRGV